jgi:hypothetical protein
MALCPVWVEKIVKTKQTIGANQVVVPKEKVVICGRKAEVYLRAHYKELDRYRKKEGKYNDLFGLCSQHGSEFASNADAWNRGICAWRSNQALSGLRGLVERVEMVHMNEEDLLAVAEQDKILRLMAMCKKDFKRKMSQSGVSKLTVDHWRQVFDECIEEFVAEGIMDS